MFFSSTYPSSKSVVMQIKSADLTRNTELVMQATFQQVPSQLLKCCLHYKFCIPGQVSSFYLHCNYKMLYIIKLLDFDVMI